MDALAASDSIPRPRIGRNRATPALLILALVSTTAFDYIWIGPLPIWLILVLLGFGMTMLEHGGVWKLFAVLSQTGRSVVIPWLMFIVVHSVIDIGHGISEGATRKYLVYSISSVLLFLMMAVWASRARYATVFFVVAGIAVLEGVIGIAQEAGSSFAWHFPDTLASVFPHGTVEPESYIDQAQSDARIRGTLQLVHKFNAMQGMLAMLLLSVAALGLGDHQFGKQGRRLLVAGALFGLIGLILAFSRSTILGMVPVVLFFAFRKSQTRRGSAASFLALVAIVATIFAIIFFNLEQKALLRLTNLNPSHNMDRVAFLMIGWEAAKTSLIFGNPALAPSGPFALPIHSVPLRIFIDTGLVGLAFYVVVMAGMFRNFLAASGQQDLRLRAIGAAGVCAFVIAFADAATHSSGFLQQDFTQPAIFGLVAGLIIGRKRELSRLAAG